MLGFGQDRGRRRLDFGLQKDSALEVPVDRMVGSHLDNCRVTLIVLKLSARGMDNERRGIMVGMPAFVRVGQHEFRSAGAEQFQNTQGKGQEVETRFLIDAVQTPDARRRFDARYSKS